MTHKQSVLGVLIHKNLLVSESIGYNVYKAQYMATFILLLIY